MHRRDFIKNTMVASTVAAFAGLKSSAAEATPTAPSDRAFYELRCYRLKAGAQHTLLDGYLQKALIPALNAYGINAVGVFTEPEAKDGPAVWVLIPHASMASVAWVTTSLNAQAAVLGAAGDYLTAPTKDNPAFDRLDSWLLLAFAGMPQLAVPALAKSGAARIFELRTYDSFSEATGRKKVDMFNAGEIGAMKEVDLSPVFYGEAVLGRDLPHLAYMLCSPDRATHDKNWKRFAEHPVWIALKGDKQYDGTVSKVSSRFLVPAAFSQI
jgi:hypothetical protein